MNIVSVPVKGLPCGGEEGYGLGTLVHESGAGGRSQSSFLKEIKYVAVNKYIQGEGGGERTV